MPKYKHILLFFLCSSFLVCANAAQTNPTDLAVEFQETVFPNLQPPSEVISAYAKALEESLRNSSIQLDSAQYVILVDRNPNVQAEMIFWGDANNGWVLIGAAPVSTGMPGTFDHFLTPLGLFTHSLDNPDFRSEGTKNEFSFRGYGIKGMRVYDFGWVNEPRGWGDKQMTVMRLQMHATDPDLAENLLGIPRSKGCIRIPASMNEFIDRYGLLDADYDAAIKKGSHFWVLRHDRNPTNTPGRYLMVINSDLKTRPSWAVVPKSKK